MMAWNSVRVKLTLWNMLVLAFVLGGFGFALCYSVQANQSAAIDRDLASRAQRPFGFGGPPGPWGPNGAGRGRKILIRRGPRELVGPSLPGETAGPEEIHRVFDFDGKVGVVGTPGGTDLHFERHPGPPPRPRLSDATGTEANMEALRRRYFGRPLFFDHEGKSLGMFSQDRPWDPTAFQAAMKGITLYTTTMVGAEKVRIYSKPLPLVGAPAGVMQLAYPLEEQERLTESQIGTVLLLLPIALLIAGLGGLFLTDRALRPVRNVTQAAAQISADDLSGRLEVHGKDEMAELARTFNGMLARLEGAFGGLAEAYRKLEEAYERQRRFTGDASHELRTPLTRIKASTSLALSAPCGAQEYREALVVADQAADAMSRIVQDLLLLARSDSGQLSPLQRIISVEELFRNAVHFLSGRPGPPIFLDLPPERLELVGDGEYLTRLLTNLLENAFRHTPSEGRVVLSARREGGSTTITVEDTGEGIAPEHLPHLCERFYRVDTVRTGGRGGTGLGLAICESIAQAHAGSLTIESRLGEGTTVRINLPSALPPNAEVRPLAALA